MQLSRRAFTFGTLAAIGAAGLNLDGQLAFADPAVPTSCPVDIHYAKRDFRAMWIATVANIDWPKKGSTPEEQKADLINYFDMAKKMNLNAVIFQVRPTADAFFQSDYEPWSQFLTGTQGQYPGYDPLAFAVEQAHARGLELHAWMNPYRVTYNHADIANLVPDHPALQHPEWTFEYAGDGKLYYNPGVPEAREFITKCILEPVRKYDIDAVHFDDYFYPYPAKGEEIPDQETWLQYGAGMTIEDWRRHNVDIFIKELGEEIKAVKPTVKFGVSPFGVWRNIADDPAGSETQAGAPTYDHIYADTRKWVQNEWIDYIAPQVYWAQSLAVADYDIIVKWWSDLLQNYRPQLYIGEAVYKVGASTQSPEWNNLPEELANHVQAGFDIGNVDGHIWYNAASVRANSLNAMGIVHDTWYSHPALVPVMDWLPDTTAPKAPKTVQSSRAGGSTTLSFRPGDDSTWQYAIYRMPLRRGEVKASDCALADASNLVALVVSTGGTQTWTDPDAKAGEKYTYVVTGVDRLWNESSPTKVYAD